MRSKIERIFAKNFARNYEKKIILGTLGWRVICPSTKQPSVLYWRLWSMELTSFCRLALGAWNSKSVHALHCNCTAWKKRQQLSKKGNQNEWPGNPKLDKGFIRSSCIIDCYKKLSSPFLPQLHKLQSTFSLLLLSIKVLSPVLLLKIKM